MVDYLIISMCTVCGHSLYREPFVPKNCDKCGSMLYPFIDDQHAFMSSKTEVKNLPDIIEYKKERLDNLKSIEDKETTKLKSVFLDKSEFLINDDIFYSAGGREDVKKLLNTLKEINEKFELEYAIIREKYKNQKSPIQKQINEELKLDLIIDEQEKELEFLEHLTSVLVMHKTVRNSAIIVYDMIMKLRKIYFISKLKSLIKEEELKVMEKLRSRLSEEIRKRSKAKDFFSNYITVGLLNKWKDYHGSTKSESKKPKKEDDHFFPLQYSGFVLLEMKTINIGKFFPFYKLVGSVVYTTEEENQILIKVDKKFEEFKKNKKFELLSNYTDDKNNKIELRQITQEDYENKVLGDNKQPEKIDFIEKKIKDEPDATPLFKDYINKTLEICEIEGFELKCN